MMGNILDEVAPAMRGSVRFIKVDSEKYPTVAGQYHIGGEGRGVRVVPLPALRPAVRVPTALSTLVPPAPTALPLLLLLQAPRPRKAASCTAQPASCPSPAPSPAPAALPTLILFKQGQPVDRIEGVVMGQDLKNRLQYLLAKLK